MLSRHQLSGRRVLVTGHTGFKGAWLTLWLQRIGAVVTGLALPPEDPRGAFTVLTPWAELDQLTVDLRDRDAVVAAFQRAEPEVVFHLGAQSLVRRGYAEPSVTYATNVCGTAHVLEAAAHSEVAAVVVVTSDKVYSNREQGRSFVENDRLGGQDPYSASKACAELVTASWRTMATRTAMATARAGNVIGGGDVASDRLLPDVERALIGDTPVVVRNPDAIRPWQFVLEPLHGYLLLATLLLERPKDAPATLNFGPGDGSCLSVREVVAQTTELAGGHPWQPAEHPGPPEAEVLRLDASLAAILLGWQSQLDVGLALAWTVEWWRCSRHGGNLRALAEEQIQRYEAGLEQ